MRDHGALNDVGVDVAAPVTAWAVACPARGAKLVKDALAAAALLDKTRQVERTAEEVVFPLALPATFNGGALPGTAKPPPHSPCLVAALRKRISGARSRAQARAAG